jgi:DNA polymerase III subunit beta
MTMIAYYILELQKEFFLGEIMKFIASRADLCEYTNRIQNIVAPKTPIPILSNFLLEADDDDTITLTATDLTCGVRCRGKAKVLEKGATTIPARRFAGLLRELTAPTLEIATNEKELTNIVADSSNFTMHGLSKSEFPPLPDFSGAIQIRMKQQELRNTLSCTSFAVSKDDNRYVLTGVFLGIGEGKALFAGTDGKRLARAHLSVDTEKNFSYECIIPLKAVDEIIKNLTKDDEEAELFLLPDKIALSANDITIVTKLLAGDYPNIDKVIPKQCASFVALHRDEMMALLRQICLFTTDTNHSVRFTFTPGELFLSVNTMDIGEGKVSMPVDYSGSRFDIAFNPFFFLDILRHSKNETVQMGFSDAFNPGIIVDGDKEKATEPVPSPLYVLMPMRLTEQVN